MVSRPKKRQSPGNRRLSPRLGSKGPLVAFDFDGTLTAKDSFTAFLRWRIGPLAYYGKMLRLAPAAIGYLFDRDRGKIKSAAIRVYLGGVQQSQLEQEAADFAAAMAPLMLRPDALRVWRRHRADGARMAIVSASPETIVAPFARGLGADLLIASHIAFDHHGRVSGGLVGRNCRGPEKVTRLREIFGDEVRLSAAYGDTDGDKEMLALSEHGFMRLFVGDPSRRTHSVGPKRRRR